MFKKLKNKKRLFLSGSILTTVSITTVAAACSTSTISADKNSLIFSQDDSQTKYLEVKLNLNNKTIDLVNNPIVISEITTKPESKVISIEKKQTFDSKTNVLKLAITQLPSKGSKLVLKSKELMINFDISEEVKIAINNQQENEVNIWANVEWSVAQIINQEQKSAVLLTFKTPLTTQQQESLKQNGVKVELYANAETTTAKSANTYNDTKILINDDLLSVTVKTDVLIEENNKVDVSLYISKSKTTTAFVKVISTEVITNK